MQQTQTKKTLTISPIFVKKDEDTKNLEDRINKLSQNGNVLVINQGEKIALNNPNVTIHHIEKPLGIWGALKEAYQLIVENPEGEKLYDKSFCDSLACVTHNLAPLYFESDITSKLQQEVLTKGYSHVVGWREDIASSLSDKPQVAYARALMECFLTSVAGTQSFGRPDFSLDGFTGLQAFSFDRYKALEWGWTDHTTWGGALQSQLQSYSKEQQKGLNFTMVPHRTKREWTSYLGDDRTAVVRMLDQARQLPALKEHSAQSVRIALDYLPEAFALQPWLDKKTVVQDIRDLIKFYNETTTKGKYLTID